MTRPSARAARARDYALTVVGAAFLALAAIFVVGRIWFRGLFAAAVQGDPLLWAGCFLAVAVVLGILHAIVSPPLSAADPEAYKRHD